MNTEIPPSKFSVGQRVRVRLNEHNHTPHVGTIRDIIWHHKDRQHNYYLEEGSKKVSKRYYEDDLESTDAQFA